MGRAEVGGSYFRFIVIMLYLFFGNKNKIKKETERLLQSRTVDVYHLYEEDFVEKSFFELTSFQKGLFDDTKVYIIHEASSHLPLKKVLPECASSENIFIFSEEKVLKATRELFEKNNGEIKDFSEKVSQNKNQAFNIFSLTDLLGRRDKKALWLSFQEAKKESSPEEIHGVLWWGLKNLFLVKSSPTKNPGMSPYVYQKNLSFAKNFEEKELLSLADTLVRIFHERDSVSSLEIELEKFILNI